jgi:serine/threonine protein kinase
MALLAEHEQRHSAALPAPSMALATGPLRLSLIKAVPYKTQSGATGSACQLLKATRRHGGAVVSEFTLGAAGPLVPSQPLLAPGVAGRALVRDTDALVKIQAEGDWQRRDHHRINVADLKVGDDLGKYRLDRFLGQGGMGRVFRALDPHLQRPVALKVLTGNIDATQSERFVKEARAVARVTHPGIVNVYDAGQDPAPYMAMEYAPGEDLSHLLKGHAPLEPRRAVGLILQVLDALAAAHAAGIIHRDLKPANVMVDADERTKLMDFGLARFMDEETRLTRAGEIWGTPEYMAPEQVDDEFGPVDSVSDLFAVATILYECLTARLPVRSGTLSTVIYDLVFRAAEPPETHNEKVTPELSQVVLRGLEKDKADRYQHAGEFAAALRALSLD